MVEYEVDPVGDAHPFVSDVLDLCVLLACQCAGWHKLEVRGGGNEVAERLPAVHFGTPRAERRSRPFRWLTSLRQLEMSLAAVTNEPVCVDV